MKAVMIHSKNHSLEVKDLATPSPLEGVVLICLSYASLNHLDLWI